LRQVILHCALPSQITEQGGSSQVTSQVDPGLQVTVVDAFEAALVFSTTHGGPGWQTKLHSGPEHALGEHGHDAAQAMVHAPPVHDVQTPGPPSPVEVSSPESGRRGLPSAAPSGAVSPGRGLSAKRSS
jgi:hypothetical protein